MNEAQFLSALHDWLASTGAAGAARRIPLAIAIVAGAFVLVRLVRYAFDRLRKRFTLGAPLLYIVEQLGGYLIVLVGVLAGISALGVDITTLTVFGGALGVGIGLGLQGVVKEFVSGVVLIFDPDIQVGDFVELEDKVRGEVVEIGARATRLRNNDDLNIVIPNSMLMQSRVINWTYNERSRRIHVPFSVAEDSDITRVREVALAAARALPFTLPDDDLHKTQVWLTDFGGDGLVFDLVVWPTLESSRRPATLHAAYTWALYEALQGAGVANANKQMDVRVHPSVGEGEPPRGPFGLGGRRSPPGPAREPAGAAPNDAAEAMFDDATRDRRQRREEPRKRHPKPPPRPAAGETET